MGNPTHDAALRCITDYAAVKLEIIEANLQDLKTCLKALRNGDPTRTADMITTAQKMPTH